MASGKYIFYSVVRDILTPSKLDFYQVSAHSIILAFILSILYYIRTESLLSSGLVFLLPVVPLVLLLWKYDLSNFNNNILLLRFEGDTLKRLGLGYLIISIVYFVGAVPILDFDVAKLSLLVPVPLYWVSVWYFFGTRYKHDERKYFVHTQGPTRDSWIRASVSMERGHDNRTQRNPYEAYYHYSRAEMMYQDINSKESRETYKNVSRLHEKAANCYKKSVSQPTYEKAKIWFDKGESNIKQSNKVANMRRCDECGEKKHVNQVFQYIGRSNGNYGESIYCRTCDSTRKSSSTKNKTDYGAYSSESFKGAKTGRTVEPETKDSSLPPRELINGRVTTDWAKEVLSIDKELTEDSIDNAFREQVKVHHPDSGGNTEDFKKVNQARKRLLSEVK